MKRLAAVFLILTGTVCVRAQNLVVILHQNHTGMVDFKNGNVWQPLRNGETLQDTCWLRLKMNAKVLILKKDDSYYQLANTADPLLTKNIGLLRPFTKQPNATGRLFEAVKRIYNKPPKVVPAHRKGEKYGMLFPADGEVLVDRAYLFSWQANTKGAKNFYLKEQGSPAGAYLCVQSLTNKNSVMLSGANMCSDFNKLPRSKYSWSVIPAKDSSERKYFLDFTIASDAQREELSSVVNYLSGFRGKIDKDLYYIMVSDFYEDGRYYYEALKNYRKAMTELPASTNLKLSYAAFMKRIEALNQPDE